MVMAPGFSTNPQPYPWARTSSFAQISKFEQVLQTHEVLVYPNAVLVLPSGITSASCDSNIISFYIFCSYLLNL